MAAIASRIAARPQSCAAGQAEAMAILMRRTLMRDQRADLEQLEADGAAGGVGEVGVGEADAAQRADQHVGHRGEPQAQLVGAHGGGRGAVGEEVELALLDAVLHLAAGAVDLLVEMRGLALGAACSEVTTKRGLAFAPASTRPWRRRGAGGSSSRASSTGSP